MAPLPGDDARYERAGLLGKGGMGRVWLANDRRLDRPVALKEALRSGSGAARLAREARVTAGLDHPGIVAFHDAGFTTDGLPFYTMPVIRGRALDAVLADAADLPARLHLVRPFLQACQAVAYAHAQGVIHRDLKPANVLLGPFGETRVADWGLATRLDEPATVRGSGGTDATLTHDGDVMGTPAYMSPEQARGAPADRRSDVWGLGAVLFEILAGRPPVTGATSAERLDAARRGAVTPLSHLAPEAPRELIAIAQRALAIAPEDRYPDAGALAVDVEAWVDGRPVAAHSYTPREILERFVRAYRLPLVVAAAAVVVLTGAQAWSNTRLRAQVDRAEAAESASRAALESASDALARSLLEQAYQALEEGALGRAEILAAASLGRADSPGARGVLAGVGTGARPVRLPPLTLPSCTDLALLGSDRWLCAGPDSVSLWAGGAVRWTVPTVAPAVYTEGDLAWVIEGDRRRTPLHRASRERRRDRATGGGPRRGCPCSRRRGPGRLGRWGRAGHRRAGPGHALAPARGPVRPRDPRGDRHLFPGHEPRRSMGGGRGQPRAGDVALAAGRGGPGPARRARQHGEAHHRARRWTFCVDRHGSTSPTPRAAAREIGRAHV